MTRDEFLTKKMGKALREYIGKEVKVQDNPDFSTWEGFGKLWEWAKEQEWFNKFAKDISTVGRTETYEVDGKIYDEPYYICLAPFGYAISIEHINPDRFADAMAKYLGWKI